MLRVAALASGRGSNVAALLKSSSHAGAKFRIVGVYSDRADAGALTLARDAGLDFAHIPRRAYADRVSFDTALFERVLQIQPDLIVCAGYMRVISADALASLIIPMINIHPSLLPLYPGLNTHARAIEAGDSEHGVSVHVVTAQLDGGPILAQARVDVRSDDTPNSLADRVLKREHQLLPACVRLIASKRLKLSSDGIQLDGRPLTTPLQLRGQQLFQDKMT